MVGAHGWIGKVIDKQGEEIRMIHMVMNWSWRHQYEFMFSLIHIQMYA